MAIMTALARYEGTCYQCGKPIIAEKHWITWSRKGKGQYKHIDCSNPYLTLAIGATEEHVAAAHPIPHAAPSTPRAPRALTWTSWEEQFDVLSGLVPRILLIGPPGTGKSIVAARNTPYRITCHEDMSPADLRGTWMLINRETIWQDGPATKALRLGAPLVLDEIDRISPECASLLYALMDAPAGIVLPTGERVEAAEGYQVIGTSNELPANLPEPIFDRIDVVITALTPSAGALGEVEEEIKGLRNLTLNYYKSLPRDAWKWNAKPTCRKAITASKLIASGVLCSKALEAVYGSAAAEVESALVTASASASAETAVSE